jgi:hypothetical protein
MNTSLLLPLTTLDTSTVLEHASKEAITPLSRWATVKKKTVSSSTRVRNYLITTTNPRPPG